MELDLRINFHSGVPIYEQIAYQVLELIKKGVITTGDQLPTTRQLAVQLGINFNTVARAYRILDQGAVISTQPGRGTFILEEKSRKKADRDDKEALEELTRYYIRKAAYLGFDREEIREYVEKIIQDKT